MRKLNKLFKKLFFGFHGYIPLYLKGVDVITVRDLIVYSGEKQKFTIWTWGRHGKIIYSGVLDSCPYELTGKLVYEFTAIGTNEIKIILSKN